MAQSQTDSQFELKESPTTPVENTEPSTENTNLDLDLHQTEDCLHNRPVDCEQGAMASETPNNSDADPNGVFGYDRLMQRMKSDLMFELRHIQHGERPVTGQAHRENLQQFMLKHSDGQNKGHNAPANVDTVEEHRPDAVVVEVQGMIERRPVSSILQSAAFRRQLENVIRGGIVSASRTRTLASSSRLDRRQQTRFSATPSPPHSVTSEERPVLVRSASNESIDSFSSARSTAEDDDISDEEFDDVDVADGLPQVPEQSAPLQAEESPRIPHPTPQPRSINRNNIATRQGSPAQNDSDIGISWNEMSNMHREDLVQEISELLHTRLVSSTLESEFRATLELHTQERLAASGSNGEQVQEFVRSLPGRGIPHNDFNHIGIPSGAVGGGLDNDLDNISVASFSTRSVPYVQTNTYLGREIQSLRTQINEMKSMLRLNFDLQMDIQRSIRQEVAAALNKQFSGTDGASASAPRSSPVNDTHCLICLDRYSDTVLYQCGHMCVCYMCGKDLVSRGHNCPVCRAPIKDVIRAYKTNVE